jgi:hypothetical protein
VIDLENTVRSIFLPYFDCFFLFLERKLRTKQNQRYREKILTKSCFRFQRSLLSSESNDTRPIFDCYFFVYLDCGTTDCAHADSHSDDQCNQSLVSRTNDSTIVNTQESGTAQSERVFFITEDSRHVSLDDDHIDLCIDDYYSENNGSELNHPILSNLTDEIADIAHPREFFFSDLINFIHCAHLNKSATATLLSLLRSTSELEATEIPRTNKDLWERMDIKFGYESFYYCSTCFKPLTAYHDVCSSCSFASMKNSELYVFTLLDELERVVLSNIQLINWYSSNKNHFISDIVKGKLKST